VSNARVAAAAETFVRRKIDDLLDSLPHPSDHTPPRVPHPPSTKRHGRPQYRPTSDKPGKDLQSIEDKEQEQKEEESEDDEDDVFYLNSSLALRSRDSIIISKHRVSTRSNSQNIRCIIQSAAKK